MTYSSDFKPWRPASQYIRRIAEFGTFYYRESDQVLALRLGVDHTNMHAIAHGGLLATLADCAMGNALVTRLNVPVVTAQMSLSFLKPVTDGAWLEAHTHIDKHGRNLVYATCSLKVDGVDVFQATAIFAVRAGGSVNHGTT
ncbi:PaaI family thioesterase [Caballeronia sp. LP006]|uniref:PaaI family thioesterase n=1 Tax=Caballeronia sp. LP006 TaxID=3038552 RepID=UPI0028561A20|nr:PaaI family thioesterase [Caballeronia sp. LP006]MDR5826290.1 PaaI family thioesterase [Caballeronia sp. LP006]